MRTLQREPALPPIQWKNILSEIQWVSAIVLSVTPLLAIYGLATTSLNAKTFAWMVAYYFFSGLGITAGYHRLWAHRAYSASKPLQYLLACMGTSAVEGSIHWWAAATAPTTATPTRTSTPTRRTRVSSGPTSAG